MIKFLKEKVRNFRGEINSAQKNIKGIIKDEINYQNQPQNNFTIQGYEVIQNFLTKQECDRLIQFADYYTRDESYPINGNCYFMCRKDVWEMDNSVQQIINAQEIDNKLLKLYKSHVIEELFEQRTGEKFRLRSITLQVDNVDTDSKRGFHSDGITPPVYKAFIYLNDVNSYGDGPYTLVSGSHRHKWRKIINYAYAWVVSAVFRLEIKRLRRDDRRVFYTDKQAVSIFGKAGTLIISNQQLAHKGWQKHNLNKRYALICYLVTEKEYDGKNFDWWQRQLVKQKQVAHSR